MTADMEPLTGKHILLGITGSIAAYKSAELVRRLRELSAEVRVVMTQTATEFITPLTMQALSGAPVRVRLLDPEAEAGMDHIALARWADVVLIAPASANIIARLAHGLADDLLTTLCLASGAPLALAPAMNHQMWENAATAANCRLLLRERAVSIYGPAEGDHACGETGAGRMLEPAELIQHLTRLLTDPVLAGLRVVVTAGPTREDLDPVRFISNRSSGKMGFAIAQAAAEAGAAVTLVAGPTPLATPAAVKRVNVVSAAEMLAAVSAAISEAEVLISVAAVADYRPAVRAAHKLKKSAERLDLVLERTTDILATVAEMPDPPFTVGFAAETEDLEAAAREKLRAKHLDLIAANQVGGEEGFEADENALLLLWDGGRKILGRAPKLHLARELIYVVAERYRAKSGSGQASGPAAG